MTSPAVRQTGAHHSTARLIGLVKTHQGRASSLTCMRYPAHAQRGAACGSSAITSLLKVICEVAQAPTDPRDLMAYGS